MKYMSERPSISDMEYKGAVQAFQFGIATVVNGNYDSDLARSALITLARNLMGLDIIKARYPGITHARLPEIGLVDLGS
jgi:hypothetical protein